MSSSPIVRYLKKGQTQTTLAVSFGPKVTGAGSSGVFAQKYVGVPIVKNAENLMTLTEALTTVFTDDARIRRPLWFAQNVFVELHDGKLCIYGTLADKLYHPWTITETDWFASDWEIVE